LLKDKKTSNLYSFTKKKNWSCLNSSLVKGLPGEAHTQEEETSERKLIYGDGRYRGSVDIVVENFNF
jgi:hypothetical protein